jgi:hypothetical protein
VFNPCCEDPVFNRLVPDSIELDRDNEDCQVISSMISDTSAAVDIANLDSASGLEKSKTKKNKKAKKLPPKVVNPCCEDPVFNRLVPDSIELDRDNEDCQVISSVISDTSAAVDIANLDSASGLEKSKTMKNKKAKKLPKVVNPYCEDPVFNRLVPDSIELDRDNEDCQVISSVISDTSAAVDIANLDSASGLGKKKKKNRRKEKKKDNTEYSATEIHESAYLENM